MSAHAETVKQQKAQLKGCVENKQSDTDKKSSSIVQVMLSNAEDKTLGSAKGVARCTTGHVKDTGLLLTYLLFIAHRMGRKGMVQERGGDIVSRPKVPLPIQLVFQQLHLFFQSCDSSVLCLQNCCQRTVCLTSRILNVERFL